MGKYIKADIIPFEDESMEVQLSIARNPNTRTATLERIYNKYKRLPTTDATDIIRALASNPNSSIYILRDILNNHRTSNFYARVAGNPKTPPKLCYKLLSTRGVLTVACELPDFPANRLLALASENKLSDSQLIAFITHNRTLFPETLDELIRQHDMGTFFTIDFSISQDKADGIESTIEEEIARRFQNDPRFDYVDVSFMEEYEDDYYDYCAYVYFDLLRDVSDDDMYDITRTISNAIEDCDGSVFGDEDWEHYCRR